MSAHPVQKRAAVMVITYNQAAFIPQTLDSILAQKVNFSWEILVADDGSTDGTRAIILDYQKRFPDLIKVFLRETNLGTFRNTVRLIEDAEADFLAICEGDDYWTDENKLQKQVDFLSQNSGFVSCCHNVLHLEAYKEEAPFSPRYPSEGNKVFEEKDFLERLPWIIAVSLVFRNPRYFDPQFSEKMLAFLKEGNFPLADWPYNFLLSKHGKTQYFDQIMAVYRLHEKGLWSSAKQHTQTRWNFQILSTMRRLENKPHFFREIESTRETFFLPLFFGYLREKKWALAADFLGKLLFQTSWSYKMRKVKQALNSLHSKQP
jgi:glycosyltransferase involved in cell wall biosynthesis